MNGDETSKVRCQRYRRRILEISQQVSALHIAPAFSCTEIVDFIYNELMYEQIARGESPVFIMSKGHGCLIQYVILEEWGVLSRVDLAEYCKPKGSLGPHPDFGNPGIHASTGSLGHGLGMLVGQAYAERLNGTNTRFYAVLSDGELQEGSTWEAISIAATLNLNNITVFVDNNDYTSLDRISACQPAFYPLIDKVAAFNWSVVESDGHSLNALRSAVQVLNESLPKMIIGKTTKGKGVSYMENAPIWHYRSPSPSEYLLALKELEETDAR